MPIPDYESAMLPLLQLAGDGAEHRFREAVEKLAVHFQLSDAERAELLPSGTAPLFDNRVGWARTYLKQAGLLESPKRGWFTITDRGRAILSRKPARIDANMLDQFEEFRAFRSRRREGTLRSLRHRLVRFQRLRPRPRNFRATRLPRISWQLPIDAYAATSRSNSLSK